MPKPSPECQITVRIPSELWKNVKRAAIDADVNAKEFVEAALRKALGTERAR